MVCVCSSCGERIHLKSEFEADGECPECGELTLVAEDAYDPEPDLLTCVDCRRQVDGGPDGAHGEVRHAGRYSVDDPCPICGGELIPAGSAPEPRRMAEYGLAKAAARKLLIERWRGDLPVDVADIAEREGLTIVRASLEHEGMIQTDERVVEIPAGEPRVAQRFAIAHELGHFVLRHKVPEDKIEKEANAFASALLVPAAKLQESVRHGQNIAAISNKFAVSRQVAVYSLLHNRLIDKVRI